MNEGIIQSILVSVGVELVKLEAQNISCAILLTWEVELELFQKEGVSNKKSLSSGYILSEEEAELDEFYEYGSRWCFYVELVYLSKLFHIPIVVISVTWSEIPGSTVSPSSILNMVWEMAFMSLGYRLGISKISTGES
ncbi:hypothetical protein Tco_0865297 [Tanacetum coccineum]